MTACPTPARADYASEGAAWAELRREGLSWGYTQLPYRCAAGHWHLAPVNEARAKRAAGR